MTSLVVNHFDDGDRLIVIILGESVISIYWRLPYVSSWHSSVSHLTAAQRGRHWLLAYG